MANLLFGGTRYSDRKKKKKEEEKKELPTTPKVSNTPKELTSEEKKLIIQNELDRRKRAGESEDFRLDKEGNISEARTREETARAKEAGRIKAGGTLTTEEQDKQILAGRQNLQVEGELSKAPNLTEQDILNTVPQEEGLDKLQAGAAGVSTGIGTAFGASLLAGKIGAATGTAVAPGVGTAIGAVAGIALGIGAYYAKIGLSQRNDVKQATKVAGIANKNFGQTIDALNAGTISKDVALQRYREDRISLYAAQANLKRETDTDLNRFLSNGSDELAQVEDYIRDLETIYNQEFLMALSLPNPQNIRYLAGNE